MDRRGQEMIEEARLMREQAQAVQPTIERAVDLAQPLEGLVSRMGRVVDRLPGGGTRPVDPEIAEVAEVAETDAEAADVDAEAAEIDRGPPLTWRPRGEEKP
jgi:hypothetical protein